MYNLSQHLPLKLFLSNTSHVMTSFSGKRFKYTPWDRSYNHIYESIEALDRKVSQLYLFDLFQDLIKTSSTFQDNC